MSPFARYLSNNVIKLVTASVAAGAVSAYGLSQIGVVPESSCDAGKRAYKIFPPKKDYPDLDKHNNCLAHHLTPKMYETLRGKVRLFCIIGCPMAILIEHATQFGAEAF